MNTIEDGCGGIIYKIFDIENSDLSRFEVAMCIFAPGERAILHFHKVMEEVYFIIEGDAEIEIDGKFYRLRAEDAISIPRKTKHRITNVSTKNPLRFLSINSPQWREDDMIVVTD